MQYCKRKDKTFLFSNQSQIKQVMLFYNRYDRLECHSHCVKYLVYIRYNILECYKCQIHINHYTTLYMRISLFLNPFQN